jgi:hypothetical protein
LPKNDDDLFINIQGDDKIDSLQEIKDEKSNLQNDINIDLLSKIKKSER